MAERCAAQPCQSVPHCLVSGFWVVPAVLVFAEMRDAAHRVAETLRHFQFVGACIGVQDTDGLIRKRLRQITRFR